MFGVALAIPNYRVGSKTFTNEEDALFHKFMTTHSKTYMDDHDQQYRKSVFLTNLNKIRVHNSGNHTFTLAMNAFGDLTWEEFHAKYTGFKGPRQAFIRSQNYADLSGDAPSAVDWTAQGAVTDVKNQGQCGSCWAFSSTGAIEGANFIKSGSLVSLSEQQLMDCSKSEGNDSCNGGLMDNAFEYVVSKGICLEKDYPYAEEDHWFCRPFCTAAVHISSYADVSPTEEQLTLAVAQQPVSVAIEADQDAFQFYSSGVMTGTCGTSLDHGVLAVGYGTLDGKNYWKVKNSWGAGWGMDGYILLEKGNPQRGGQCGILMSASYPTA